jgi:hypothetical protein
MLFGNQTVRSRPQNSHSSQLKLLTRPENLLPRGFVIMGLLVLIPQEEQVDCLVSLLKPPIGAFLRTSAPRINHYAISSGLLCIIKGHISIAL